MTIFVCLIFLVPLFFLQGSCCCPGGDGDEEPPPGDTVEVCCDLGVVIELPTDLIATFENTASACGCTFDQTDVPLTYDEASTAGEPIWRSDSDPITQCPGVEIAPVRFSNDVGGCVWTFHDVRDEAAGEWAENDKSCDPFSISFLSPDGCMRATVTEAAP